MAGKKRSNKETSFIQLKGNLLGDARFSRVGFPNVDQVYKTFQDAEFRNLKIFDKHAFVSKKLYELICESEWPCFLLPAVVDYITHVQSHLPTYNLVSFELWLNQYSGVTSSENLRARAKIAGKFLLREGYQSLFPIGKDTYYPGSHYVLAHFSPDLDTFVSSFWGWVDAFAARVGEGQHYWQVPERLPESPTELEALFSNIFGPGVFDVLLTHRKGIRVTALDLMSQERITKKTLKDRSHGLEGKRQKHAVVLVDDQGDYLGDWRSYDVDAVRGVVNHFNAHLRLLENAIHQKLISLFAKQDLKRDDVKRYLSQVFHRRLTDNELAGEYSPEQKEYIDAFIREVLKIDAGYDSTFEQFITACSQLKMTQFEKFQAQLLHLPEEDIFNGDGQIIEDRPRLFSLLEKAYEGLSHCFKEFRDYVDTLDCAFSIKKNVFGLVPNYLSHLADIEEIQEQMKNYPNMTVVYREPTGQNSVMGAIFASDLQRPVLGTVSFRDFGNYDEAEVPDSVMPISLFDHHRTELVTNKATRIVVADVQSCNVIVAELAMEINDRHSTGGMEIESVEAQMEELLVQKTASPAELRILQRLLQRKRNLSAQSTYFISPEREYVEYLHFIFAILDDTDFLTKVTLLDVECMASLLNRLKSLALKKEVEIIHFDDLPKDGQFVTNAAKKLQQSEELYSLYQPVYKAKEKLIEETIGSAAKGMSNNLFVDTKYQNGCAIVSQVKMFSNNIGLFQKSRREIQDLWIERSKRVYKERSEADLYLFMACTLISAEELHFAKVGSYDHQDELWCWCPENSRSGQVHLKMFLQEFLASSLIKKQEVSIEYHGKRIDEFRKLVEMVVKKPIANVEEFPKSKVSLIVLKIVPGSINSRKLAITPCLP